MNLIEERMRILAKDGLEIESIEMMRENAIEFLKHIGQKQRAKWLQAADEAVVDMVRIGQFHDVCPLPHMQSTVDLRFVKLLKFGTTSVVLPNVGEIEVIRIRGIAFGSQKEQKGYAKRADKAKRCDHRKLGKELRLFYNDDNTGAGLWVWEPKGATIRETLLDCACEGVFEGAGR